MKMVITLLVVGLGLGVFAWWGTQTAAGRRQFDEMAGMIPLGAGVLAALLVVAAGVIGVIRWMR